MAELLFQPKTGTVTGQVAGRNGDPLTNVMVYLDQQWVPAYTDDKGFFILEDVPAGENYIVVEVMADTPEFFLVNIQHGIDNDIGRLQSTIK